MHAELAIVDALQSARVPEKARAAAVTEEIDHRYEIHNRTRQFMVNQRDL